MIQSIPDRIGFRDFRLEHLSDNRCGAVVLLAWPEGDGFIGAAQGDHTETGRLRCAAEATARALEQSVNDQIALDVQEVQTMDVEREQAMNERDINIVVVLVSGRVLGEVRLLVGSCLIKDEPPRRAALAVLKATKPINGRRHLLVLRLTSSLGPEIEQQKRPVDDLA